MSTATEKIKYKNPPVVERVIGVYKRIPQEEFEAKLSTWVDKIRSTFPVPEHLAEWRIDIEDRNGIPFVKNLQPKARIIHLFWKKHPKNKHVIGMRLRPDRLVFHLRREDNNAHEFEELVPYMQEWLPRWQDHFGVGGLDGITVEYFNILDGNITPKFASQDGVRVGEMLTLFGNFPGGYQQITNPYDCKVRLIIDLEKRSWFDFRVRADEQSAGAVAVNFEVSTFPKQKCLSPAEAISEILVGHDIVLKQFSCFFTEKARASFL